jgi:CubicO group peptidase (beta-lactamase class C family)
MKTRNEGLKIAFFVLGLIVSAFNLKASDLNTKVARKIDSMRVVYHFPSVAYGVIRNDSIIVLNAVGYRDSETMEKSQPLDHYNIGSNTKAFTGFLAAKLVEEGLINWDTRFFDLFPEFKAESNPAYFEMTLKQLLSHRARMIHFNQNSEVYPIIDTYEKTISDSLSPALKRYYLIREVLKHQPLPPGGEGMDNYSNAGFIAAALMLEKVTGKSWESLISKLSDDLNLEIHVGWPNDVDIHQPKGHINPKIWQLDINKELIPITEELKMVHHNHQYILLTAPCGDLCITLKGFLKFLQLNIDGMNGKSNYLKSETYRQLLDAFPVYSMGWWIEPVDSYLKYGHRGSNGTFYSFAGFSPEHKVGMVVMVNTYKEEGITDIINLLLKNYAKK